jgi:opacity protein-like surface antigen
MSSVKALKLAVAVAALVATGSAAQAQDNKAAMWAGAYAGVHIGGEFAKFNFTSPAVLQQVNKLSGVEGGAHAGFNWQAGSMVYGIEGDADLSGAKKSYSVTALGITNTYEATNSFLGSLRGRIGYAVGDALIYTTGGVAFSSEKIALTSSIPANSSTNKDSRIGYVLGLGVDYALSSAMSLRLEGLHYGFSDVFKNAGATNVKFDANVIRTGISYKF